MKAFILSLTLLICYHFATAKTIIALPEEDGKVVITGDVDASGLSRQQALEKAEAWMMYNSRSRVSTNFDNGRIDGTGTVENDAKFLLLFYTPREFTFNVSLSYAAQHFTVRIYNIQYSTFGTKPVEKLNKRFKNSQGNATLKKVASLLNTFSTVSESLTRVMVNDGPVCIPSQNDLEYVRAFTSHEADDLRYYASPQNNTITATTTVGWGSNDPVLHFKYSQPTPAKTSGTITVNFSDGSSTTFTDSEARSFGHTDRFDFSASCQLDASNLSVFKQRTIVSFSADGFTYPVDPNLANQVQLWVSYLENVY